MNNWINRTHIAMVLNGKRGWNRPRKYDLHTWRFFECIEDNLKLRFAAPIITFSKHGTVKA